MRKVLTITKLMKMSKAELARRAKRAGKKTPPAVAKPDPDAPHPILRKWAKSEKPIIVIE